MISFEKKHLILSAIALSVLCVIGTLIAAGSAPSNDAADKISVVMDEAFDFSIGSLEKSHAEDYPIAWIDPGMEAHIRFLMDKPEGTIYHSDVWDVEVLSIYQGLQSPFDGWYTFSPNTCFTSRDLFQYRKLYQGKVLPEIASFEDLKHFDQLQVLSLMYPFENPADIELSGLEFCEELRVLWLQNVTLTDTAPISALSKLENLMISTDSELELPSFSSLSNLTAVTFLNCELSLQEEFSKLPQLCALKLRNVEIANLDFLQGSRVETLDLLWDGTQAMIPDCMPITKCNGLYCLSIQGHPAMDSTVCTAILEQCTGLKYLNIKGTPAAQNGQTLKTERLTVFAY